MTTPCELCGCNPGEKHGFAACAAAPKVAPKKTSLRAGTASRSEYEQELEEVFGVRVEDTRLGKRIARLLGGARRSCGGCSLCAADPDSCPIHGFA